MLHIEKARDNPLLASTFAFVRELDQFVIVLIDAGFVATITLSW